MTAKQSAFSVGDVVEPKPDWVDDPNMIPSGIVREVASFGDAGALYVADDHRAFAAYVFNRASPSQLDLLAAVGDQT